MSVPLIMTFELNIANPFAVILDVVSAPKTDKPPVIMSPVFKSVFERLLDDQAAEVDTGVNVLVETTLVKLLDDQAAEVDTGVNVLVETTFVKLFDDQAAEVDTGVNVLVETTLVKLFDDQ